MAYKSQILIEETDLKSGYAMEITVELSSVLEKLYWDDCKQY